MKPAIALLLLTLCSLQAGEIDATSLSSPGLVECDGVKVDAREDAAGAIDLKLTFPDGGYSTTLDRTSGEPFLIYWDKDTKSIWAATPTGLHMTRFSQKDSHSYFYNLACGLKELHPPAEFVNKVRALNIAGPGQPTLP